MGIRNELEYLNIFIIQISVYQCPLKVYMMHTVQMEETYQYFGPTRRVHIYKLLKSAVKILKPILKLFSPNFFDQN